MTAISVLQAPLNLYNSALYTFLLYCIAVIKHRLLGGCTKVYISLAKPGEIVEMYLG